ncbi:MAG: RNA polymerase sigma factor [Eubacterium sp.]|nr:RNA polymerase sigma factor [Eubacterium sp.]
MSKTKAKVIIDEAVFEKIASGDSEAMKELYEQSYKPIFALLLSLTRNYEDAEDLLQETFIKIGQGAHLYVSYGNPMAWMMKIARNIYISKKRTESKKSLVSLEELGCEIPFEQISRLEDRMAVENLFQILDREERSIIVLHLMEGFKFKEIAQIVEKPLGTVLAKYNRGLKKMKKQSREEQ